MTEDQLPESVIELLRQGLSTGCTSNELQGAARRVARSVHRSHGDFPDFLELMTRPGHHLARQLEQSLSHGGRRTPIWKLRRELDAAWTIGRRGSRSGRLGLPPAVAKPRTDVTTG